MRATPLTERELTHLRGVLTELYEQNGRHTRKTAKAIGWTKASVSDVLNGRCGVGVGLLTRLSKVTGRPIDDLLGRSTSRAGFDLANLQHRARSLIEAGHAARIERWRNGPPPPPHETNRMLLRAWSWGAGPFLGQDVAA